MAKNYLDTFVLPNNSTYYFRDNEAIGSLTRTGDSLIVANRTGTQTVIPNTDFDTINVTELNAGNLIVTGAARFLNPINGSITGQAGSVANSLVIQLNSGTTEGTNKFTYNGSASKTVNITKSSIGLGNVENKSSATIRGEITSANVTTALGYTPATSNHTHDTSIATSSGTTQLSLSANTKYSITAGGTSFIFTTPPDNNTTYTFAESSSNGYFTVTPSGGSAQSVKIHGLGTSAFKNITDTYSETGTDPVTGKAVKQALDGLPEPMVFKGTVGSSSATYTWDQLPTPGASNEGWTFKAIENHSTAPVCKNGDTLISNGSEWTIVPSGDEPSGTVTSVAISNGGGLSVSGGPITSSGTITISHADTSSQASVSNSGRTYIQSVTLDTYGHVTKLTSATETVTDTNYYHKTGTWSGLTYTAAKVGSPDDLAFTIPTGTTATTVALGNHNHDGVYLKLSGGTMTGVLTLKGAQYEDSYSGALNANNSNIYNLNSIYTADAADAASEGIHFYRDTTHVDTLWVSGGNIMFVPNRALGTSTTAANSQKVGRFTTNPTSGQVVITDGTTGGMKSSGYTIATSVPANAKFTDTTYSISASGESMVLTGSNSSSSNVSLRMLCPPIHPKKFMFNTGIPANGTWCKLFSANYSSYNFLHIDLMTYHGYSGVFRTHLTIRFTTSGFAPQSSSIIFHENILDRFVVTQDDTTTFSVWIKCDGVNSRIGYEILGVADESKIFYKDDNTFSSTRWVFPETFETSSTEPTMSISNVNRFVRDTELGTNAYSSVPYLPLAGGTMVGPLKFGNQAIPQFTGSPSYILGIESFASGGDVKWQNVSSVSVGSATKATQDESGNNIKATYMSSLSVASNVATFKNKNGTSLGTITASTASYGSASAGTAISADDITAWDAGSTPTLGTAISADDITAWSAGTMFSASFDGKCTLTLTSGSVPTLSYTGRTIPNVTSVGSVPTLSYTARSIPNISVSSKTVVTGIS